MILLVFKRQGHTFKLGVNAHIETNTDMLYICFAFPPLRFSKGKHQLILPENNLKEFVKKDVNISPLENLDCN